MKRSRSDGDEVSAKQLSRTTTTTTSMATKRPCRAASADDACDSGSMSADGARPEAVDERRCRALPPPPPYSRAQLTRRALRQLDQRNRQLIKAPDQRHRQDCYARAHRANTSFVSSSYPRRLSVRLARYARHGGPDISDLRGVSKGLAPKEVRNNPLSIDAIFILSLPTL